MRKLAIQDAINKLTPKQKSTIELLIQGNTYEEISRILNISKETVKNRIIQAKKAMGIE